MPNLAIWRTFLLTKKMEQFKIKFKNTYPFILTASDRNDALKRATKLTQGIETYDRQRKKLVYCKQL